MRAGILVLGPMLARYGNAKVSTPGGCTIGVRPIDIHLKALAKLGVNYKIVDGYVHANLKKKLNDTTSASEAIKKFLNDITSASEASKNFFYYTA